MTYTEMKNILLAIDNPIEKLDLVMDLGRNLESVPNGASCHEILGCTSFVEICVKDRRFYGRADSVLVRGIVAIIIAMVNQFSYKNFDIRTEFLSLGLNLGAGRLNGVDSMIRFFENL